MPDPISRGEEMANTQTASAELFPILDQAPTGLARMAAEATHHADGHNVEFRAMDVRSILNRTVSRRQFSFRHSINPYRGCEFACRYCYARYTHEFLGAKDPAADSPNFRDPNLFERLIFLKENAAWLLEQELKKIDPTEEIALGTATDPYQPIERTAQITRSLLEVFARQSGLSIGIITKSKLIERDIDLLTEISRRNTLVLHLTITTPDPALARLLEPRAPRPDLRFAAVSRLREVGLTAGILCSPLLPGITDTPEALDAMASRAAQARASFLDAQPLFLKSCSRPTFLSFVREHFPHLAADYAVRFAERDFAAAPYRQHLASLVRHACRRHGLGSRPGNLFTREAALASKPAASILAPAQAALFA
jgi:DNA repair photolyase